MSVPMFSFLNAASGEGPGKSTLEDDILLQALQYQAAMNQDTPTSSTSMDRPMGIQTFLPPPGYDPWKYTWQQGYGVPLVGGGAQPPLDLTGGATAPGPTMTTPSITTPVAAAPGPTAPEPASPKALFGALPDKIEQITYEDEMNITPEEAAAYRTNPEVGSRLALERSTTKVSGPVQRQFLRESPNAARQWYQQAVANGEPHDVFAYYDFLEGLLQNMQYRADSQTG